MENPFRPVYAELTEEQKQAVKTIKDKAMELYEAFHILCEDQVDPRCLAAAKTHLETTVMWATKAVTKPAEPKKEPEAPSQDMAEPEAA